MDPVKEKLTCEYKQELLNDISRMEDIRCPKQILDCWPVRRQRPELLRHTLLDRYNCGAETGLNRSSVHLTSWLEE